MGRELGISVRVYDNGAETVGKTNSCVYLVGAGPGDPELLTRKAYRILESADAVVYDRLVSQDIVDIVPPGCTRIFVGKTAGNHTLPQDEINDLLVKLARTKRSVVRLKGGDPYIFGRGSEEALQLSRHNIAFEIIPGITAASGISAATGIPLTHRGMATSVRFVTGHGKGDEDLDLDWRSLADGSTTLVIYMGMSKLPELSRRLIAAGLPGHTPAAAVANGTTAQQRQCISTLEGLPEAIKDIDFTPPVLCLIGEVVSLAHELNWQGLNYESLGLEQLDALASA
ncbi:MAG: uroporphyrinogen-III C-methyltransferase [Magnetovibrio sp.]|nr:uroporphyrinogen-III C-methyltransferase [Magnetovibrio sp.]